MSKFKFHAPLPVAISPLTKDSSDVSIAKFPVYKKGELVCHAYLYDISRWWLVTPKNAPAFPTKKGHKTWNYTVPKHETLEDALNRYF